MKNKPIYAWKFMPKSMKIRHGDGRTLVPGEVFRLKRDLGLKRDSEPILCRNGFHASESLLDATKFRTVRRSNSRYYNGTTIMPMLCLVELSGRMTGDTEKICATRIKLIERVDVSDIVGFGIPSLNHMRRRMKEKLLDGDFFKTFFKLPPI